MALFGLLGGAMLSLACGGGSPGLTNLPVAEDVAGTYDLSLGKASNACGLDGFDQGDGLTHAKLVVTQNEGDATAKLTDAMDAAWLDTWLASNEFTGSVASNHLVLTSEGKATHDTGDCTFKLKATIDGHVEDDVLDGTISYVPVAAAGDCAALSDCHNEQTFTSAVPTK